MANHALADARSELDAGARALGLSLDAAQRAVDLGPDLAISHLAFGRALLEKGEREGAATEGTPVHSTFSGTVEIVDILAAVGDRVGEGDVIAQVEAMKAKHDIRTPVGGIVRAVHVQIGSEIDRSTPIMTIG